MWMQSVLVTDTPYLTIHHAHSEDQGLNWSYTVPLTPSGRDRFQASMDVDPSGIAHFAWWERPGEFEVWYTQLMDGNWEEKVLVTHTQYVTRQVASPDVVAAGDLVHLVWSEKTPLETGASEFDLYYSRSDDWDASVIAADTSNSSLEASMAVDAHGDLHLVWAEDNTAPLPRQIMYISGTVDSVQTVWSAPITVTAALTQNATTPAIAVGQDDVLHVVFGVDVEDQLHTQDVYYARFPISDTGSISPTILPGSRVRMSYMLPNFASPSIAVCGSLQVHVAWNGVQGVDYSDRIYYSMSEDGGLNWTDPFAISPKDSRADGFPALAVNEESVYLVFQEGVVGGDNDVLYTRRFPLKIQFPLAMKSY